MQETIDKLNDQVIDFTKQTVIPALEAFILYHNNDSIRSALKVLETGYWNSS